MGQPCVLKIWSVLMVVLLTTPASIALAYPLQQVGPKVYDVWYVTQRLVPLHVYLRKVQE